MKKAYWLVLLFGVWCSACGIWYMFGVKGISTDPHFFDPQVRGIAILEILVMLLIACLIGYSIGWAIQKGLQESLQETIEQIRIEKGTLFEGQRERDELLSQSRLQLAQAQQTFTIRINNAKQETDSLKAALSALQDELLRAKEHAASFANQQPQEKEADALRYRIKQLEFQSQEMELSHRKLQLELQETLAMHNRKPPEPIHPFVRPVEMNERDDLTRIKGIGPFIEKRLNMVGIYTYRQISEFTPEMIEHVTKAIEFFPNRITRDNWVGQATKYR